MPWRYIIFTVTILTAACGASKRLAGSGQSDDEVKGGSARPAMQPPISGSEKISGRSIAPGGAGGRQS